MWWDQITGDRYLSEYYVLLNYWAIIEIMAATVIIVIEGLDLDDLAGNVNVIFSFCASLLGVLWLLISAIGNPIFLLLLKPLMVAFRFLALLCWFPG